MYAEVIVTGILLSLLFQQFTELSPSGLIVAGYLALNLTSPWKLLLTLLVSLASLGVYKLLSRYMILYGQRRFAVLVLISLALSWGVSLLPLPVANVGVIGYLIPAIIARECDRQGILKNLLATAVVTLLTFGISLLLRGITL